MISWLIVAGLFILLFAGARRRAARDALQREELRAELLILQEEKRVYFSFLHELGEAISEDLDQKLLLQVVLHCAINVTDAQGGALYLLDKDAKVLRLAALDGPFPPPLAVPSHIAEELARDPLQRGAYLRREAIPLTSLAPLAAAAHRGEAELIRNVANDPRFPAFAQESLQAHSYLAVPLEYRQEILGVIAAANRRDGHAFTDSDLGILRTVAQQAAYSLHVARLSMQLAEKRKLDSDLATAKEIQRILLPDASPQLDPFSAAALNLPAQQVSGDYYDFIPLGDGCWGLVIADVSGKGIPASLIMAMCRSMLRSIAPKSTSPARILRELNRQLYPDIREDMFITMTYLVLNPAKGTLRLARAGHEPPLLYRHATRKIETVSAPGLALGIDPGEIFDQMIEDVTIELGALDTLVLYTDGLTETTNAQGNQFGQESLRDALQQSGALSVDFLVKDLVERVQRFSQDATQADDITLLALQRLDQGKKSV